MPTKFCLNHKEVESVAQCHQCHKPVCEKCLVSTGLGDFCSATCQQKNKNFKETYKEPKLPGPSLVSRLFSLVLTVAFLMVVVHLCVRFQLLTSLAPYDLVGKYLPF
ncbi:MAG: hypothetical protein HYZ53_07770 [Planctomycetes bacterium]|nr:hypothetical protein [Planctomycetota bacterium]